MDIFVTVMAAVTVSQAAEHYGLQDNRNGMTCSPFHDDRHPSMKLNERYFYCFGCGATGDVIDLVAKLFDLSSYEAAKKLAHDFGIGPDKPPSAVALPKPERPLLKAYPNLAEQDTQYIPKSIEDGGKNLTLSDIQWQTDNTANMDGYAVADRYTAVATYTGSTTSSYVKGYTVTADYTGTVSRIALNRVRYVAIFEGVPIQPAEPAKTAGAMSSLRWSYVLIPIGVVAAAGAGVGGALLVKRKRENADEEETEE